MPICCNNHEMALFFHRYPTPLLPCYSEAHPRHSISALNTSVIWYSFNYIMLPITPGYDWTGTKLKQSWPVTKENSLATQTCIPALVRGLAHLSRGLLVRCSGKGLRAAGHILLLKTRTKKKKAVLRSLSHSKNGQRNQALKTRHIFGI